MMKAMTREQQIPRSVKITPEFLILLQNKWKDQIACEHNSRSHLRKELTSSRCKDHSGLEKMAAAEVEKLLDRLRPDGTMKT